MGVVGRKRTPPSRISSEGGGWELLEGKEPLRLAFQAREGRGVVGRKRPPPSRISSKGGLLEELVSV